MQGSGGRMFNIFERGAIVARMDHDTKVALARQNDDGMEACAIRLRAAIKVTGKLAKDFASDARVSKTVLSNAVNALSFPNREVMKHLFRSYRIDFNFLMNGDFVQLPGDVQDVLFPALEAATSEWDRKAGSDRPQTGAAPSPSKT